MTTEDALARAAHLPDAEAFARALLDWYDAHRRDLPWRRTRDPYAIWVSEIMLQQTQVARVAEYFARWMERFPTVQALAEASLDDVLKLWEGLGYYSRARNVHKAARVIVNERGGRLPQTAAEWQTLPGVGPYTAAAIASIAFDEPVAALDGNLKRVLARVCLVEAPINTPEGTRLLNAIAQALVPPHRPGDWNQALMDVGANICVSRSPRCLLCPLRAHCAAAAAQRQHDLPRRQPRRKRPHYIVTAALIWNDAGQLLIAQRPHDKMLGGLWEFPGGKCEEGETLEACLRREIREELGIDIEVGDHLTTVEHGYTHFSITLHAFHCRFCGGEPQALGVADWRWVSPDELDAFAWPSTDAKIIAALRAAHPTHEHQSESED